ncbi:Xis [Vibrio phage CKB-S1]|nr:Xis [Vibrio phage CKB-S1]
MSEYMTTKEAAEALGVSRPTVRAFFKEGRLEGVRISPRIIKIKRASVDRILKGEQHEPNSDRA